jgi:hypothetical protein
LAALSELDYPKSHKGLFSFTTTRLVAVLELMLILFVRGDIEMKSSYITLTQHIEKADYLSFAAVIL